MMNKAFNKFCKSISKYIFKTYNKLRINKINKVYIIMKGNENLAFRIYCHINDLLDILNLNSFFDKMIKNKPIKLSKQLYYEHINQSTFSVIMDVVNKKI